jgi:hypothetical protein
MTSAIVPSNHVIGLVSGSAAAAEVAAELRQRGFDHPIIASGDKLTDRLEAESGLMSRALQKLFGHLSEETNYLRQYEEAVRRGQTVVAVKAEDEETVDAAREVLEKHGAADIRFFGQLAVKDLTPESNPSHGSDQAPVRPPSEAS